MKTLMKIKKYQTEEEIKNDAINTWNNYYANPDKTQQQRANINLYNNLLDYKYDDSKEAAENRINSLKGDKYRYTSPNMFNNRVKDMRYFNALQNIKTRTTDEKITHPGGIVTDNPFYMRDNNLRNMSSNAIKAYSTAEDDFKLNLIENGESPINNSYTKVGDKIAGFYNSENNVISLTPNATKTSAIHELSHRQDYKAANQIAIPNYRNKSFGNYDPREMVGVFAKSILGDDGTYVKYYGDPKEIKARRMEIAIARGMKSGDQIDTASYNRNHFASIDENKEALYDKSKYTSSEMKNAADNAIRGLYAGQYGADRIVNSLNKGY